MFIVALPCPKLEEIENGVLTVDSYDVGSTATYQCARGYRRFGPRVRQCLPTALWSGSTPVCVPRNPTGNKLVDKHCHIDALQPYNTIRKPT